MGMHSSSTRNGLSKFEGMLAPCLSCLTDADKAFFKREAICVRFFFGKICGGSIFNIQYEAVRELESTGGKSTGICTGCTAAGRHI